MIAPSAAAARPAFDLPEELAADRPPEARGIARDMTRLLVIDPDRIEHVHFRDLPRFLAPGDLVVINTSATLPAAVDGRRNGERAVVVHFSARLDDGTWIVELRSPDAATPLFDGTAGEVIALGEGVRLEVLSPHSGPQGRSRLLRARVSGGVRVEDYLGRFGRPISYSYVHGSWPLAMYQTVFALDPGSAEMPSAARPFTPELVTRLVTQGVTFAPVLLHAGVSSPEAGEPPAAERFRVPATTARLVNQTRRAGGFVIAVGTTVTRALESATDARRRVAAADGWTDLVLGPERPAQVVDAVITGWHAPEASHPRLLQAVAGAELVERAYDAAREERYLWHEFGDAALFLPRRRA